MSRKVLLALVIAIAEMGQISPQSGPGNSRIQSITYYPDQTVTLQAAIGFALVVELSEEEHIENIVVGNSGAWQVTANKRGDHLVIKPMTDASETSLVVTTDNRRYIFLLRPSASSDPAPFVVHFEYPEAAVPALDAPSLPVAGYTMRGTKALFPSAINDDGRRTIVTWGRDAPLPAIFASDSNGREAIINGRMVGGDYVIEGIAPRYVFRLGKAEATATRRLPKVSR